MRELPRQLVCASASAFVVLSFMKALHEFAQQGDGRTAWPLTHFPDPIQHNPLGGTEVEMECMLAVLKTKDDLKARSKAAAAPRGVREQVSGDEEEKPEKTTFKGASAKKKARQDPSPPAITFCLSSAGGLEDV